MSYSFTYQGVDFGGENYRVYVTGTNYQQMPRARVSVDNYAQSDGAALQGTTFDPRRITLVCQMTSDNDANRAIQMDNVIGVLALSQSVGGADLSIDQFPGKVFTNARLVSELDSAVHARMDEFTLEFVADSWPSATEATEASGNNGAGGVTTL